MEVNHYGGEMKTKNLTILTMVIILLIVSLACDISFGDSESSEEELRFELTRQSFQQTQIAAAAAPPASAAVPVDSSSDDKSSDEVDTSEEDDDSEDTCNMSKFVSETIPDGSVYQAGNTFTKKWVIRNNGTCDWTTGYRFVFEEGDQMDGATSMNLDHTVKPGESYTFEVDLTAPAANGDYTGVWRIKSDDGEKLGKYWVKITVGAPSVPSALFAVTSVSYYMPHTAIDMACPGPVAIKGEITTSAAGTVTYYWIDDLGGQSAINSVIFAAAESKIVDYTMTVNAPDGAHWAKLYIDQPNHQLFSAKNFTVNCP
jgi:hypothetical protein